MTQVVEHQQPSSSSSRQHKRKLYLILFFIIFFATIISSIIAVFTVLKRDIESERRAIISNPDNLVREICRVAPYYHPCDKSMSSLIHNHRSNSDDHIHLSDVLRLSIRAAYDELYIIRSLPKELASTYKNSSIVEKELLADCQSLFEDSLERLNKSLIMIPEYYNTEEPNKEKTFFNNDGEAVITNLLVDLIIGAGNNLQGCIDGLRLNGSLRWKRSDDMKRFESSVREAEVYVLNALAIVEKKDDIYKKLFKPISVSSVFASLMLDNGNGFVVMVSFCLQYMMLMLLVCVLLRVFR